MVKIEQSLCIGCAKCVKDCVSGVLHIDQGKAAVRESCMQCGHCVAVCPVKAVSIPEYDMADVAEYDKDRRNLRNLKHTHGRAGCLTRIRFPQNRQT